MLLGLMLSRLPTRGSDGMIVKDVSRFAIVRLTMNDPCTICNMYCTTTPQSRLLGIFDRT